MCPGAGTLCPGCQLRPLRDPVDRRLHALRLTTPRGRGGCRSRGVTAPIVNIGWSDGTRPDGSDGKVKDGVPAGAINVAEVASARLSCSAALSAVGANTKAADGCAALCPAAPPPPAAAEEPPLLPKRLVLEPSGPNMNGPNMVLPPPLAKMLEPWLAVPELAAKPGLGPNSDAAPAAGAGVGGGKLKPTPDAGGGACGHVLVFAPLPLPNGLKGAGAAVGNVDGVPKGAVEP